MSVRNCKIVGCSGEIHRIAAWITYFLMIVLSIWISRVSIEVWRVCAARSRRQSRFLFLRFFLTLLIITDNDCILVVMEMTTSSTIVLSSPRTIKTQDHPIQGTTHLIVSSYSAALVWFAQSCQFGRHLHMTALCRIEVLTSDSILKWSPWQCAFQGILSILHVRRYISISCPCMESLVKGWLRHLRDRRSSERHIIIRQIYLVHQIIYLLLVLSLCLVKISHHDWHLSWKVNQSRCLLLLAFGTSSQRIIGETLPGVWAGLLAFLSSEWASV